MNYNCASTDVLIAFEEIILLILHAHGGEFLERGGEFIFHLISRIFVPS